MIAGNLGQQFVRGDADSCRQPALRANPRLQFAHERQSLAQVGIGILRLTACRQVEIRLVNRHLLNAGAGAGDDLHDLCRLLPVPLHARSRPGMAWSLAELRHLELLHFAGNATRSPVFVRGTQFAN